MIGNRQFRVKRFARSQVMSRAGREIGNNGAGNSVDDRSKFYVEPSLGASQCPSDTIFDRSGWAWCKNPELISCASILLVSALTLD